MFHRVVFPPPLTPWVGRPSPGVVSQARNSPEPGQEPSSRRRTPLRCGALRGHSVGMYPAFGACPALGLALTSQPRRHPTAPCPQAALGQWHRAPSHPGGVGAGKRAVAGWVLRASARGSSRGGRGGWGKLCGRSRVLITAFLSRSPP